MGLWNDLLSLLGWGEKESSSREAPKATRPSREPTHRGLAPGSLRSGSVEYIGDTFAKVQASDVKAVIFLREMADHYIEHPSEVLHEGQAVDFVLLERSDKRPDEWVGSIDAASEARIRTALSGISEGDRVNGRITDLKDRGAILDAGSFDVWIPISELAWGWVDHPSESVSLGDDVTLEIIRVEFPDGWLSDKRKRRARAVGSLRACLPQPESPIIPIVFSGLPFKVWAITKTPRNCDPIVLYVLEDLVAGRSPEDIQVTTGLPRSTLDCVHEVLTGEGLVKEWRPIAKGKRLAEAVALERELNADPIRGLFASAAHPSSQFVRAETHREQDKYPRSWPRPPFNKPAEDTFARATDEALPELLIDRIVSEDKREILARLQEDDRMRVFLRRDGSRPWKPVFVDTPEHWLLAGLWSAFEPVGQKPYRPANGSSQCRDVLMVRMNALARKNGKPIETIFFEPYTATLWRLIDSDRVVVRDRRGSSFPEPPKPGKEGITLPSGKVIKYLRPDSWCVVGAR